MRLLDLIGDFFDAIGRFARKIPVYRRMLTGAVWMRILALFVPFALIAALLLIAYQGYERVKFGSERVRLVEDGIRTQEPKTKSHYCDRLFGHGPEYPGCYAKEKTGYAQFKQAWENGRDLGTVRDQLIGCYLAANKEEGVTWQTASHCSEGYTPAPDSEQQIR